MQSRFEVTVSSRKRSDIDIMASILGEARKGARKTRIMYRCNLSHRQLHVYLRLLLGMDFLGFRSNVYEVTAKGFKFLDAYRTLKALMT
jgi:predicted transcriptional regulator